MKYIFWGSPEFAAIILEKLIGAEFIPEAVACNPDRPFGRKKIITPPPTKIFVAGKKTLSIPVLQPEKLDKNFISQVSKFNPGIFIVAAYSKIIPQEILDIPKFGTIGVHPSLLPKYRGASPIQSAVLNGEKETGTTLYLMDAKMDNGPILAQKKLENGNLDKINYEDLEKGLAELSADLLIETLPKFIKGEINPLPQNQAEATFTKKFLTQDGFVDLKKNSPIEIERKVRALNPDPGVWTIWQGGKPFDSVQGKRMKILGAELGAENNLILKKIQFEGKKPQTLI
jgi:methionyl-tRNA formyltransferase